ncbi:hypothetical protein, partial [Acetomicrobium sp. S15 = DSM 107314]|uniref:hypothetical protein n=1 Tax=Acetomicrobium sp. S15 = DSM 107314 TaxID=2529858 RepID=UPI001E2B7F80
MRRANPGRAASFPKRIQFLEEVAKKERGRRVESTPPHLTFRLPEGGRILVGLNAKGNRFVT